jgi:LmbE family N-acetylglucosaminyl deacetylase
MSKKKHHLLVVSHPDDESLFFAGLVLQNKKYPWHVVCVTDGNADGQGLLRAKQFEKATRALGAKKITFLGMPDKFESRLDIQLIQKKISDIVAPEEVYTHGPLGEYGHPHHQDVSFAVHQFFNKKCKVISVAHNCVPDKVIRLTENEFAKKSKILSEIYFSETERFIHFVPATAVENFACFTFSEVENIYKYFAEDKPLERSRLKKYRWFWPYFESVKKNTKLRPF